MTGNSYGSQFFVELNELLKSVDTVKTLLLADIFTTRKEDILVSCELIVQGFSNKNIKFFDISNNALCPDGCKIIGKLFKTNQSIKYLWLNHVAFSRDGTEYISQAIEEAKMDLVSLQVNKNRMGEKGYFFGRMLASQTNLKDLILYQNDLKDGCLLDHVKSIKVLQKLEILDLSDNLFNSENFEVFCESLLYLKDLKTLNISDCNINPTQSKHFIKILDKFSEFSCLEKFCYNYNEIDEEDLKEFFDVLSRFKNLKNIECKIELEDEHIDYAKNVLEEIDEINLILESDEEMSIETENEEDVKKKEEQEFKDFLNNLETLKI